jgi:hypothetical protein
MERILRLLEDSNAALPGLLFVEVGEAYTPLTRDARAVPAQQ